MMKYSNRLRYQYEDLKAIEHELEQENQVIVNCWTQVTLFLDNDGSQDEATKAATTFLDGRGFGYAVDRFVAMPLMMEIMPLCHGYDQQIRGMLQRQEVFTSKYLSCAAPIYGPWKGNSNNPVLVGYSREGQIISIDPSKRTPRSISPSRRGRGR